MPSRFAAADALSSAAISSWYGEKVRLIPWKSGGDFKAGGPDTSRAAVDFQAVYAGEIGDQNLRGDERGEGFNGTMTTKDRRLSVNVPDWPTTAKEGDRIQRIEVPGGPLFEIIAINPDEMNRIRVEMVKL